MKKWSLAGMVVLAFSLTATVAFADHSWNGYHWGSDKLSPRVFSKTTSSLYDIPAAVQKWADLGTLIQPAMAKGKTASKGDIIVMESVKYSSLAHTEVSLDKEGHITKAYVYLNTALLELYGPAAADQILCHELGHALGLAHEDDYDDSCMNDTIWPGTATSPNAHDAEQLNLIYGHQDGKADSDDGSTKKGGGGKGGGKPSK